MHPIDGLSTRFSPTFRYGASLRSEREAGDGNVEGPPGGARGGGTSCEDVRGQRSLRPPKQSNLTSKHIGSPPLFRHCRGSRGQARALPWILAIVKAPDQKAWDTWKDGARTDPNDTCALPPDRQIVDRSRTPLHQPVIGELPVFVAIGAKPVPCIVMPLVSEAHRDSVGCEGPELLDEAIVELLRPLASQEADDFLPTADEIRPIAPVAIRSINHRNELQIAGIPSVLSAPDLLFCGLMRERWQWGDGPQSC